MKAVVVHQYGGPEVLKFEDYPDPVPGAGEVLVRVAAASVNPLDLQAACRVNGRLLSDPFPGPHRGRFGGNRREDRAGGGRVFRRRSGLLYGRQ